MKCPKCGNELKRSQKDPDYLLCYHCKKKYKKPAVQTSDEDAASEKAPAAKAPAKAPAAKAPAAKAPTAKNTAAKTAAKAPAKQAGKVKSAPKSPRYEEDDYYGDYDDFNSYDDDIERERGTGSLKTWKLISGILSILLFAFVAFQSCAAGLVNTLSENGELSGSAGLIVAILLLVGGIVSIATRKRGNGGNIALLILYIPAAAVGFLMAGKVYKDLYIWASWCVLCALMALVSIFRNRARS